MRPFFILVTLLIAGSASAATITFEEFDSGPLTSHCPLETSGFTISGAEGPCVSLNNGSYSGNYLWTYSSGFYEETFVLESSSGASFTLSSLDYVGVGLELTGYYTNGGTVQTSLIGGDWSTAVLDSSWQGLQSVEIFSAAVPYGSGIDNIVVSAVPIPAAVWLFGSALAGLGWMRRKQTF